MTVRFLDIPKIPLLDEPGKTSFDELTHLLTNGQGQLSGLWGNSSVFTKTHFF